MVFLFFDFHYCKTFCCCFFLNYYNIYLFTKMSLIQLSDLWLVCFFFFFTFNQLHHHFHHHFHHCFVFLSTTLVHRLEKVFQLQAMAPCRVQKRVQCQISARFSSTTAWNDRRDKSYHHDTFSKFSLLIQLKLILVELLEMWQGSFWKMIIKFKKIQKLFSLSLTSNSTLNSYFSYSW